MNINPNVDRISLEDRIKALEARQPGGGPSGSHAWQGSFMFDPKSTESLQANKAHDLGYAWLFKLDVPNTSDLSPWQNGKHEIKGLGIKALALFPKFGRALCEPTMYVARLHANPRVNNVASNGAISQLVLNFDLNDFKAQVFKDLANYYIHNMSVIYSDSVYFGGSQASSIPSVWADAFNIRMQFSANTPSNTIDFIISATGKSLPGSTGEWFSWGASIPAMPWIRTGGANIWPNSPIGKSTSIPFTQAFTGKTAQSLPAELQPLYPNSWYA